MTAAASSPARTLRNDLFRAPPRLPLIAPSILSADFARLGEEARAVIEAGADLLHLDVMDGHFAPNLSMGPALCRSLRKALPGAFLDVHLMVKDPGFFLQPFADAGADHCTLHIEVIDDPRPLAERCHALGMSAGLAFNPDTPAERVLPFAEPFDLLLCMSVVPGFSGQKFKPEVLPKCRAIKPHLRADQRLEIDGGVAPATVEGCRAAGCDVLVAATAVYGERDYAAAIRLLRGS